MDLISSIGVAGATVGAFIAIARGFRALRKYVISPILNHFEAVHRCISDVEQIKKKLDYELNSNGGNSLRDQVKNIGASVLKAESLTLAILSCSDKGIWIADEGGSTVWANSWFDDKLHWSLQDMMGAGWKNTVLSSDRDKVSKEFVESVKDRRDFIMDFSYIHKDNSNLTIKVHVVCHPMKRNSGEIIGFIGFATEIKP